MKNYLYLMDNFLQIYIFILIILNNFLFSLCECNKETPILIDNECKLKYCLKEEFSSGVCSISNSIIKTQWLNSIIIFDFYKLRYGSLALNSKGDLIYECSVEDNKGIRIFYWLKKDGNFYFKNENGEETPIKEIIVKNGDNYPIRYESKNSFVFFKNENSEYLISISLFTGMVEIYDFENNDVSLISTYDFTDFNIYSKVSELIELKNNNDYLYIFIAVKIEDTRYRNFYLVFQKYSFLEKNLSLNSGYQLDRIKEMGITLDPRIVSGFYTDSNIFVLFYINNNNFIIGSFDENYECKNYEKIGEYKKIQKKEIFYKCIKIQNNLGAFIFYNYSGTDPQLKIFEINNDYSFKEKYNTIINSTEGFESFTLLNDLIKINDKRFSFITCSSDRKILYIILFDLYNNNNNIKERIYEIKMYDLYNFTIYQELSSILYNNYLSFSMSYCNTQPCDKDNSKSNYFSLLMIFGYVNGTDTFINISEFLSEFSNNNNIIDQLIQKATINNNIFGYEFQKSIKLISIPTELSFYNIKDDQKIKINNEEILDYSHEIVLNKNIQKLNKIYYFEYQHMAIEPELNKFDQYTKSIKILTSIEGNNANEEEFSQNNIYFGKTCKAKFKLCYDLCETCESLGISFDDQKCLTCINNYNYYKGNCYPEGYEIETEKVCNLIFYSKNNECLEFCSYEDILNKNCYINATNNKNTIINDLMKNHIIQNYKENDNIIIESDNNYIFQLTNSLNEENTKDGKNINNYNLSMIDLGECENLLKRKNNINNNVSLIIYKMEKVGIVASQKNIQYEVYNPENKQKLDLSICENENIDIYIPITLSDKTLELREDLLNYGYDLFNPNDSFYQDICTEYTSANGTDVLLSDRKIYYFNNTETSCQENCEYSKYISETQQLKYECNVKEKEIEPESEVKFEEKLIYQSFYDVLKYSNFKVLKCYKLVFSLKGEKNNWGSVMLIIYFIIYAIFNCIFFYKGFTYARLLSAKILFNNNNINKNINIFHNNIFKNKEKMNNNNSPIKVMPPKKKEDRKKVTNIINIQRIDVSSEKMLIKKKEIKNQFINFDNEEKISKKNKNKNDRNKNYSKNYKITDKKNEMKHRTKANDNSYQTKIIFNFNHKSTNKINYINKKDNTNNNISDSNKTIGCTNSINVINNKKDIKNNLWPKSQILVNQEIQKNNILQIKNLTDFELNELSYSKAVDYDKRSFFIFYKDLIKREHLIIFTFLPMRDYNIYSIKISKFIFSISLDFALNVVFFFDDTMHKIYLDYGKYNFIYQIPQIIYSTLVSEALDVLLKYLCLTEKDIYKIKNLEKKKNQVKGKQKIFKIIKCMKIKLLCYFLFTFLFMCFFWYFIAAFCAVYKNTQVFFIKDSMLSLLISILYPFVLYLLPTALRILSLKDKKKRLKFLYVLSDLIPII